MQRFLKHILMYNLLTTVNVKFRAEPWNLTIAAEFPCFHSILRSSELAGDNGTNNGIFWSGSGGCRKLITTCRHDCAVKYTIPLEL